MGDMGHTPGQVYQRFIQIRDRANDLAHFQQSLLFPTQTHCPLGKGLRGQLAISIALHVLTMQSPDHETITYQENRPGKIG